MLDNHHFLLIKCESLYIFISLNKMVLTYELCNATVTCSIYDVHLTVIYSNVYVININNMFLMDTLTLHY